MSVPAAQCADRREASQARSTLRNSREDAVGERTVCQQIDCSVRASFNMTTSKNISTTPMVRFKSSEDTLLIDMVIEHPVLWNPKSADFNDRVKRDEVWRAIGRTLNRSEKQCRIRWRSIRDHYKRQKKQDQNSPSGPMPFSRKRAFYWNKLGFLDAQFEEEESYPITRQSEGTSEQRTDEVAEVDPLAVDAHVQTDTRVDDYDAEGHSLPTLHDSDSVGLIISNEITLAEILDIKRRTSSSGESVVESVKSEKAEEELPNVRKHVDTALEPDAGDDIDLFFRAMAATVKKFHPANRTDAKMKVFNIISEIEIRNQKQSGGEQPFGRKTTGGRTSPDSSDPDALCLHPLIRFTDNEHLCTM